jgi:hypothetical protein
MITFYFNNLLDDAALDATSQNNQFKLANLKDARRTKVYRSLTNNDDVILDVGQQELADSFFIVDNKLENFGINSIQLSASNALSFSPDLIDESVTLDYKNGQGLLEFNEVSARYYRLSLSSTLGYCELANFFIGKKLGLLDNKSINFGWTHREDELLNKSFNQFGQQFTDIITTRKIFNISFSLLNKDQLEQLDQLYDYCGTVKPFWVKIGCPSMSNELARFSGMVFLTSKPTKTNTFFNRYSLSMELREAT